jgi:hypothetical protein
MTDDAPTPTRATTVRLLMWEISSPLADRLFAVSNAVLIIGAAMVLIGTIGAIALSGIREQFSNGRLSDNETKTALAIAESDTAKKGAAEANARALEAQLALEKFKAPRVLADEEVQAIAEKLKPFSGQEFQIVTYWEMQEPLAFANQIYAALDLAGWKYIKLERATVMLGGTEGVQVWTHPNADEEVKKAADALTTALTGADVVAVVHKFQNVENPKDNKINLNVGTKP